MRPVRVEGYPDLLGLEIDGMQHVDELAVHILEGLKLLQLIGSQSQSGQLGHHPELLGANRPFS